MLKGVVLFVKSNNQIIEIQIKELYIGDNFWGYFYLCGTCQIRLGNVMFYNHLCIIISPDESRGYIGFRSVAPPPPPPPPPP